MLRRLSETLTATHLVALFAIAVAAPSALYAVTAFTNVTINDATSGATAAVDNGRRLFTYDPIAGYTHNPSYLVNIRDVPGNQGKVHTIFTVPNGKVLLIRSITFNDYFNNEGSLTQYYLYDITLAGAIFSIMGIHAANNFASNVEPGVVVRAGALQSLYSGPGGAYAYIQGELLPASVVPAAATAQAAEQFVTTGAAPKTPLSR